ncbi:hypothetical protein CRYUN_Cryun01aG0007000 [Craigia yunnanensis]
MTGKSISPNVVTYSSLIHAMCNSGQWKEVMALLKEMLANNCKPNVFFYNILVDALWRLSVAEELYKEMSAHGLVPNMITYSTLLHGFCKHDGLCKVGQLTVARELVCGLSFKGLKPDVYTHNIMIKGLCKEGLANEAYELFRKMEVNGCLPNDCSYNVLIQGFLQNNDISTAAKILPKMVSKGFSADISTATMKLSKEDSERPDREGSCNYQTLHDSAESNYLARLSLVHRNSVS